ncbi:dienelactone hydrolase family protein [Microbacterium sp. MPKO10]|uniref:dienelactone hydrolase family protein n=1 Tax=Microbacterium sp. MPKO10 TaxID=2989818 RepID=UPI002236418B|nr:dienelactone hydrolase family protein [Microbacterium sp. MPKO10]MCW4458046.1 dienelactone hydrolase family protein [Microbacterium sp. MPKO10]
MPEIALFHHVLGRTAALDQIADRLRASGHTVHQPDLFDGRTFDSIDEGIAFAQTLDHDEILGRAEAEVEHLPEAIVYLGFSMGSAMAQNLVQNRPGALGGIFMYGCADPALFGTWPDDVPVHIHAMDADPFFVGDDANAAQALDAAHEKVNLFLYRGDGHLFLEAGNPDYDQDAAELALSRIDSFLTSLDMHTRLD